MIRDLLSAQRLNAVGALLFPGLLLLSSAPAPVAEAANGAYRIGAGDRLNISILDKPDSARREVPVAPDGSVSFLQASDIVIGGLTIPEARKKIEETIKLYHTGARVILTPAQISGRSYTILGQVARQGSFPLQRKITLLQAIAASGGIAKTGNVSGQFATRADLERSFVVRRGRRLAVDFSKLYHKGDVRQNIVLQPDDYIYIASNLEREFYVFGAVKRQGLQRIIPKLSVIGAVTRQNGFAEGAWTKKVLLVRNAGTEPQTFILDVGKTLAGQQPDVLVKTGDIVYVHTRPWRDAEQILGRAFTSFVQAMSAAAVDKNVND